MPNQEKSRAVALMSVTAILTGVESAHFFSAKLPSTFTIREFITTEQQKQYIYDGLIQANIGSGILAIIISLASKYAGLDYWYLPGIATIGVAGFMTASYLYDLSLVQITPTAFRTYQVIRG
jgi:hypothetical protein